MRNKRTHSLIKDMFNVMSGNVVTLIASIVTGLFVPKILGVTNYGYYRMFVLYTGYASLLHFGFLDGIVLKDGGKNFNELNKIKYRSNSIIFIISQIVICLLIIICSYFVRNNIYSVLMITVGISTPLINITGYYRFVSQIALRFKQFSMYNIIQALLIIVCTLLMWAAYKINIILLPNYLTYINIMIFIYVIMFIIYILSYKSITFGKHDSLISGTKRVVTYCKYGIYLTISYQVSNLILIIDNQFVSIFFKASTYGKYSFAYSMTNTVITILSAVATVLLPHLKRDTISHMIEVYPAMMSSMMMVVYFFLLGYFPLRIFIKIVLPRYIQSLSYFKIFLPELGVICCVTMITFNYYNALNKSKFYFFMSLIILFISVWIDIFMNAVFRNPVLIAFGSFIALFIWYIVSEYFLIQWYHVKWLKNLLYMLIMVIVFFIASNVNNLVIGLVIYLGIYVVVTICMFKNIILEYFKLFMRKI